MSCGIDNIPRNIHNEHGKSLKTFPRILSIPRNIIVDLNIVMVEINLQGIKFLLLPLGRC